MSCHTWEANLMDQNFTAQLFQLLQSTAVAQDSATQQNNTTMLNQHFYGQPHCLPALVEIATSVSSEILDATKQLAGIEARKRVSHYWSKIQMETRQQMKQILLSRMFTEQNQVTRQRLVDIVAAIANIELPKSEWDELISHIMQISQVDVFHREILASLCCVILDDMKMDVFLRYDVLLAIVFKLLVDADSFEVRLLGLKSIGRILAKIKSEKAVFDEIERHLNQMVSVLQEAVNMGNDSKASIGFQAFDEMLSLEYGLHPMSFGALVRFLVETFSKRTVVQSIRVQAGNVVILMPIYSAKPLLRHKLVDPILLHVADILVEPLSQSKNAQAAIDQGRNPEFIEDVEYDYDNSTEDTPSFIARQIINTFSEYMPPVHVFPCMHQKIMEFDQSLNPYARRASCSLIRLIVDGCSEQIEPMINDYISLVLRRMEDTDVCIRKEACIALSALSQHFDDEIKSRHEEIMCILAKSLQDANSFVVKEAVVALDAVLENLGEEVVRYLPNLMQALGHLMQIDNITIKQNVIGAIGSAAFAAEQEFLPYFPSVLPTIMQMVDIKSEESELMTLRCIAIDALSSICQAVGVDAVRPHFQSIAVHVMNNLDSLPRIKRCYYVLLEALAKLFKAEFKPLLPALMTKLMQSIQIEEEKERQEGDFTTAESQKPKVEEVDLEEEESSDDEFRGQTAIAEEQAEAIDVIGTLTEAIREQFLEYIEICIGVIIPHCDNSYEQVRQSAVQSLLKIIVTLYQIRYPNQKWVPGLPINYQIDLDLLKGMQKVMEIIIETVLDECERDEAAEMIDAIQSAIKICGPALVSEVNHLQKLVSLIQQIFKREHISQTPEEDDEEDDGLARSEGILVSSAGDLFATLATAMGPQFALESRELFPFLLKFFNPKAQASERSMVLGCMGELCDALKENITPWTDSCMQLLYNGLHDQDKYVTSNSAYALGMLVSNSKAQLDLSHLLQQLHPLFQMDQQTSDNACGALARIELRAIRESQFTHLQPALELLLSKMPLKSDFVENKIVFEFLCRMMQCDTISYSLNFVDKVMEMFAYCFKEPKETLEETRVLVSNLLSSLMEGPFDPKVKQLSHQLIQNLQFIRSPQ